MYSASSAVLSPPAGNDYDPGLEESSQFLPLTKRALYWTIVRQSEIYRQANEVW